MKKIHTSSYVPKYRVGNWLWDKEKERIAFQSFEQMTLAKEEYIDTGGYKFARKFDQLDEVIFLQEFQRPDSSYDADVILVQDIKNLVLYLAPPEIITKRFVQFVHTRTVHRFIHALIIYFEYFLKMVEFVMVRRDEITGERARMQNESSNEVKRIFSSYLTQYRLLLAREYSQILLGQGEMKPFYHITPIVNISQSIRDKGFHESFLAYCTQVVWISMHRRAYDVIDMEMCRLFRSEHFKLTRYENLQFSRVEASMLYGKNYRRVNYRAQNSPLIQEIISVSAENQPILWIGERKYRGNDLRIHQLELEYMVPDSQLSLIDVTHGILGHPKKLYNTMLTIDWQEVRIQNFSEVYDPYRIIRQPTLRIPKLNEERIRKYAETYESYYKVHKSFEKQSKEMMDKWTRRDRIVHYFKTEGVITDVWLKCVDELKNTSYGPSVSEIIDEFVDQKRKLRKT